MPRSDRKRARLAGLCSVSAVTALAIFANNARAEQPPAPCHPNPTADADETAVRSRGDVVNLPGPLQDRLAQLANRPHTYLPLQVFNEADGASQLGLPTDPTNPRAFNDVFTDISPLFVINNESGWYEGRMIHDITVPAVAKPRSDGHAQFGTITARDAAILQRMGTGNNVARTSSPSTARLLTSLAPPTTFLTNKQTSSRSMRVWGLTMPSSNRTSTPIGSSTI
jgi:hypothetical protein